MRRYWLQVAAVAGAILVQQSFFLPVFAASPELVGADATYSVTGSSDGSGQASGPAGSPSETSLTTSQRTQRITSRIIAADGNSIVIRSMVDDISSGTKRDADYRVLRPAALASMPGTLTVSGNRIEFSDSTAILRHGKAATLRRTGYGQEGWIQSVTVSVTQPGAHTAILSANLLRHSRLTDSVETSVGLWLIPTLMAPSDVKTIRTTATPLQPISGGELFGKRFEQGSPAIPTFGTKMLSSDPAALAVATCNTTANSTLRTYDNHTVGLQVWNSSYMVCGHAVSGAFDHVEELELANATAPNWIVLNASCNWVGTPSSTSATGAAQADFLGVFPFGVQIVWEGHASHQITLNISSHQVWLTGEIDYLAFSLPASYWAVWKKQQFYNGTTYPNDGTPQDASWYILDSF